MAKAVFVTYFTILSITFASAYQPECASGPEYWCKSFQNAEGCGALRHCTDTVWRYDAKSTHVESSANCEWCQKILEKTHQDIQHLANNEDLIRETLGKGCQLFPFENLQSKCSNALTTYGASIGSLMKYKRYATLCHLMNICSNEPAAEVSTTEKPMRLGQNRCTWGPSYWCSSLSNTRECQSIDHCSNRVWSQQLIEKKSQDAVCQYCQHTVEKLRTIVQSAQTEVNAGQWLASACSMLATKEAIDECLKTMSEYADEILVLIKANVDSGVICHLSHMCKDTSLKTREGEGEGESSPVIEYESKRVPIDEQSKMLCNVLVKATSELHFNQHKTRSEIEEFLRMDCQKLDSQELVEKCENLVDKYGIPIHGHVVSNIEPTKICDYLEDFADHTQIQSLPKVHCELCSFVLAVSKYMIDAQQAPEKVFRYIEEQVCSRLTGSLKSNCQKLLESNGRELLHQIESGTKSTLLCTRFQVCMDEVLDSRTAAISKKEKMAFLKENICDQLGTFKEACHAFLDQDGTRLMKTLVNEMEGDVLCRLFGICPKKMSLLDNLSIRDDTNKCKRCVADFTRRKHIAEKLVNHSAEFLHHLCGQLPQKDDCVKTVDESLDALVTYVQSLDPEHICEQLQFCNETLLKQIDRKSLDVSINDSLNCTLCKLAIESVKKSLTTKKTEEEVLSYLKNEICSKLGALQAMCERTLDTEGPSILSVIAKDIDPKKACTTLGICTKTSLFDNCNDRCECCMDKVEVHEVQIATFLREMVGSIERLCEHIPENKQCLQMTKQFSNSVNQLTSRFNSKQVCQLLTHCSSSLPIEIETLAQCQTRIDSKKQFLLSAISSINENLKSLCEYVPWNKDCYPIIDRSTLDTKNQLSQLTSEALCSSKQSFEDAVCMKNSPFENLCRRMVSFDENSPRMEALFKSMFNQNGHLDQDLCEYQPTGCPQLRKDSQNCQAQCEASLTAKKNDDLKMIETIRVGLLATCDWSLTKEYCTAWFNRVCDRLKDQLEQLAPKTFCQQSSICPRQDQVDVEPCQRCKTHFTLQTNRFRKIVSEVTNSLTSLCTDNDCRALVQSTQQQTLGQIDRIEPSTYCERYGYCLKATTSYMAHLLAKNPSRQSAVLNSGFEDRLELAITNDICFQFGQLRPMCEHLMASKQAHRYNYIYLSLLKNDPKLIDDDLREQVQTKPNTDVCQSCKNAVQSAVQFWNSSLESVRNVLLRTCERCSAKDQCRAYYNRRFNDLESYLDSCDAQKFCQNLHLCSTSNVIVTDSDQCSTCVERLEDRRNDVLQAVNRLASYFDDLCQRFAPKQCQVFVKQIQEAIEASVRGFDAKKTCQSIGFCSGTDQMSFDVYEKQLVENIESNLCANLGVFKSLCQQVLHGNRKQIQTAKINFNVKDLMQIGEQMKNGLMQNPFSAANMAQCDRDKCQCCVDNVNQKKDCLRKLGDNVLAAFTKTCDICPAKDQCRHYWQTSQAQFDSYINDIDAKQVCTRLGFCNASALCQNMGIFQQSCEDALNTFTQAIEKDKKKLEEHLPHTSVVVLPAKEDYQLTKDSNSTCILCEYVMNILSNYIHEKSTEEEIEQSLQKVCNQMPGTLQQQCHDLVNNYGPAVIAVLINDFDLTGLCRKLNLCTKEMNVQMSHLNKASTTACSVCDYVSTYIDFTLKRDPSEKALQHALANVCTHLSQADKSQCQTLVQLFAPNIRQMTLQLGKNFCRQLPICQAEKAPRPSAIHIPLQKPVLTEEEQEFKQKIVNNLDETPQCMLCHYVITYLDAIIKTNKSEEAIEAALEKVCTILPSKERAECEQFVKTYGPVLAELISQTADPDTVCRYLGMCQALSSSPSAPLTYPNHDYVRISQEQTAYTCTICQYLIGRMKHFVQENQTEEEILVSLKQSCKAFSAVHLQEQCEQFLEKYSSYIIQMIASDVQPKVACQTLGLCLKDTYIASSSTKRQSTPPTTAATSTLYGKCIFGINYWCTSRQNAQLCNAVEICEKQVWSKKNKNIVI